MKRGIATSPGERCKPAPALPQSRLAAREIRPAHDSPQKPDSPAAFLESGKDHAAHWPLADKLINHFPFEYGRLLCWIGMGSFLASKPFSVSR